MQSVTEQDLLTALFASMPQAQDRPPGAYLCNELYEACREMGGQHRIGKNKLLRQLKNGIAAGTIELVEVSQLNIWGRACLKPMYRLKNSGDVTKVV